MAIVTALHDPLTVFLADDFADVVTPDDDRADGWATGIRSIMGPGPREIESGAGIAADLRAHIPSAPCGGPARIMTTTCMMVMA